MVLLILRALAFAGCVLLDLLPGTEVECQFAVPVATWGKPPPTSAPAPVTPEAPMCPLPEPPSDACPNVE